MNQMIIEIYFKKDAFDQIVFVQKVSKTINKILELLKSKFLKKKKSFIIS